MNKRYTIIFIIINVVTIILILDSIFLLTKREQDIPCPNIKTSYLVFEQDEYDFGIIDKNNLKNEMITKDFIFLNISEESITILSADVSCSCLAVTIPQRPILAGEQGVIKITLDPQKISNTFYNQIFITTNIKDYKWLLRARGTVKKN